MSSYDFIIDGITFSYSSISTFNTCPYAFKLGYIDKKPRVDNFFGEYGRLVHDCVEKFFAGELEIFELTQYFKEMYPKVMLSTIPPYPRNMEFTYTESAIEFFDNFAFNYEKYDIRNVEKTIHFKIDGTDFTGRPDLVLTEKKEDENVLVDFKTSKVFRIDKRTGKETKDTGKIDGYKRQMFLYTYGLRTQYDIPIHKIMLWFTRPDRQLIIPWRYNEEKEAVLWAADMINKINLEEKFPYDNSNSFFCNYLCNVREACEYRAEK